MSKNNKVDYLKEFQQEKGIAKLGNTLLVINPVSQSGQGSKNGRMAFNLLRRKYNQDVNMVYTKRGGHAREIVQKANTYDSIIAIGGDGLVHEVGNGIMQKDKKDRPKFGVIPVGSGNDYARSLGMSFNTEKAVDQIMDAYICPADVGKCNDQYFFETLSFGLDAGIAVDTMKMRKINHNSGFKLYAKCGINRIIHHFDFFDFELTLDDNPTINGRTCILAIQNGPTYGGGFKIIPDAALNDGLLNICFFTKKINKMFALLLFSLVPKGLHTKNKNFFFGNAKKIKLNLSTEVPCQMDGEEYNSNEYFIENIPSALKVYKHIK